jgi:hypothetical protein
MAKIASAINVPFGRWHSFDTAAFLNPLGPAILVAIQTF